jgi:HAD superfamily hydrolase (TIGR01509 family)
VRNMAVVLLDFGHTIVDFVLQERALLETYDEARALLVAHARGEVPSAQALLDQVSRRVVNQIDASYERQELQELDLVGCFQEAFRAISLDLPEAVVRTVVEMEHQALCAELYLPPANAAALQALRADGFRLGIVSNMTFLGDLLRGDLDRLGILDLFDAVIFSSEIGVRKPHPQIYAEALRAMGATPQTTIFVGDRLREDVGGPRAAGMRAVLSHQFRRETPEPGGPQPDALVDRLGQLPEVARMLRAAVQQPVAGGR